MNKNGIAKAGEQRNKSQKTEEASKELYTAIFELLETARIKMVNYTNTAMVKTYFEIGRLIVEYEQQGRQRAEYGKETLKKLSEKLTSQFGRGFSKRNLEQMRAFYSIYGKTQTCLRNLD